MNQFTYITEVQVKLNGKHVGTIREVLPKGASLSSFVYFPKGQKIGGDMYPTLAACKASLEGA